MGRVILESKFRVAEWRLGARMTLPNRDKCHLFGDRLRTLRTAANKTLGQTARHMRYSLVALSEMERGTRPPPTEQDIRALCVFLGVQPGPLLDAAQQCIGPLRG